MKRKINILAICILASIGLFAQDNLTKDKDCTIVDFPYVEDFESGGLQPECWTQDASNNHDWIFDDDSGSGAYEGTYYAKFDHETSGDVGMLVSPVLDLMGLTSPKLTFLHSQEAYGADQDELRVYYRGSSLDPWTLIPGAEWTNDITEWTQETFILPSPNSTYQIAFEAYDDFGYSVRLDYIVISEEVCAEPTNLAVSNITESSVDLTWNANSSETMWNLIVSTTLQVEFESASIIEVNGIPEYDVVGLLSNTTYYLYVQAECSEGDGSDWVLATLTTDCEYYVELPLDQDFDGNWENWCWRVIDNDGDGNTWRGGADHVIPHSGSDVANGSGSNDDYLILPKLFLDGNHVIRWYDYNEHATETNTYDVLLSTTTSDISSFTTVLGTFDCDNNDWDQKLISLLEYDGQAVYIAFHQTYSHSLAWGFGIDDVRVELATEIEEENDFSNFEVYPNPTSGLFNFEININKQTGVIFEIFNITGQMVETRLINVEGNHIEKFDLTGFSSGIYTVKALVDGEQISKRLIIE